MRFEGRVTNVIDGDTFEMETADKPIRLGSNLDTPERGQHGYEEATQDLVNLIFNKVVIADTVSTDKYNRYIADVTVDGKSVNEVMLNRNYEQTII